MELLLKILILFFAIIFGIIVAGAIFWIFAGFPILLFLGKVIGAWIHIFIIVILFIICVWTC